jgi:probable phosphomutase (TIGR03848 family)
MPTVVLVRHGRTAANISGVLAGRSSIGLDETGRAQAEALATRMRGLRPALVLSSPLRRCVETAEALGLVEPPAIERDDRLLEADYGDWAGRDLGSLARSKLWRVVQDHPSAAVFPGSGEGMADVAARAVRGVRDIDRRIAAERSPNAVWVAVSHGDVIKAVLADALGMHLDMFQRIVVDPCSVSVVRYTPRRPFVLRMNDTAGSLEGLQPTRRRRRAPHGDAAVGGGAGDS